MMDYDKIYERVVRRGDEILEQRRKKAVKIRQTSYAVSGLCAAVITGVGIWRMTDLKKIPDNHFSEVKVIEDSTTTNSAITTAATESATTYPSTTKKTSTSKTSGTVTSSSTSFSQNQTTKTTASTAISVNNSVNTTISVSDNSAETETNTNNSTVQTNTTLKQTTTATAQSDTTIPTTTIAINVTTVPTNVTTPPGNGPKDFNYPLVYRLITLSPPDESLGLLTKRRVFAYHETTIEPDNIVQLIEKVNVNGRWYDGEEYKDVTTDAELYEIKGCSPYAVAAVKFEEDGEYYMYSNIEYQPATLEELISAFDLAADDISRTGTYDQTTIENIDTAKAWEYLTEDTSLPNIKEECDEKGMTVNIRLKFVINSPDKPWLHGIFAIDSRGYIWTSIDSSDSWYYIGREKAREITKYFNSTKDMI